MVTRLVRHVVPLVVLAALGAGAALAATGSIGSGGGTVASASNAQLGTILVSATGRTLYHMTAEKRGTVKCAGGCTTVWPPLLVTGNLKPRAGAGVVRAKLGTIKRPDGHVQVTYAGYPLYRYAADAKAGDVKGEGVGGIWFALTPAGKLAKPQPAATSGTTTNGGGGYGSGGY